MKTLYYNNEKAHLCHTIILNEHTQVYVWIFSTQNHRKTQKCLNKSESDEDFCFQLQHDDIKLTCNYTVVQQICLYKMTPFL